MHDLNCSDLPSLLHPTFTVGPKENAVIISIVSYAQHQQASPKLSDRALLSYLITCHSMKSFIIEVNCKSHILRLVMHGG